METVTVDLKRLREGAVFLMQSGYFTILDGVMYGSMGSRERIFDQEVAISKEILIPKMHSPQLVMDVLKGNIQESDYDRGPYQAFVRNEVNHILKSNTIYSTESGDLYMRLSHNFLVKLGGMVTYVNDEIISLLKYELELKYPEIAMTQFRNFINGSIELSNYTKVYI